MAKTINCRDVGGFVDCDYELVVPDGDEDLLVETTIKHASKHHPQIVVNLPEAAAYLRSSIEELKRQAHFSEASDHA